MTLAEMKRGSTAKIVAIDSCAPELLRLMELGLTEGTVLKFLGTGFGGDPMEVEFCGMTVSLRHEQARRINVAAG